MPSRVLSCKVKQCRTRNSVRFGCWLRFAAIIYLADYRQEPFAAKMGSLFTNWVLTWWILNKYAEFCVMLNGGGGRSSKPLSCRSRVGCSAN